MTATKTKPRLSKASKRRAAVSPETPPVFGAVFELEVKNMLRHPDNRRPKPDDVAETAESMKLNGQLEAVLVRQLPKGKFQLLSGETRFLAAKRLKWKTLDARSTNKISDAQALKMVAAGNAARHDLDPVQRAKLVERLCTPETEGGAGLTQEAAGAEVGLSRSAAANSVRLLKLPESVLDAVSDGRLPESFARGVIEVFEGHGAAIAETVLIQTLPKSGSVADELTRDEWVRRKFGWGLRSKAKLLKAADRWDKSSSYELANPTRADAPAFFKITPSIKNELKCFEFNGNRYCLAKKRFNELNKAAVQTLMDKASGGKPKSHKMSPADRKAKEKRAKQLYEAKLAAWRASWIRELICEVWEGNISSFLDPYLRFVNWILAGGVDLDTGRICEKFSLLLPWAKDGCLSQSEKWKWFQNCDEVLLEDLTFQACLTLPRKEPNNVEWPSIPHEVVDDLARQCGISLSDQWVELPFDNGGRRHQFYLLHDAKTLDKIGQDCAWDLSQAKTRKAKIELLLPVDDVMPSLIKRI